MKDFIDISNEVLRFIEKSPSAFHAVNSAVCDLEKAGFKELLENKKWLLVEGEKYFVRRNGSSLIAFCYSKSDFDAFNIIASHSDSPSFKIKENHLAKVESNYTKINTEPYGGMIMSSWFDRALSLAGRIQVKRGNGIKSILVDVDEDLFVIPNLAIHMSREVNSGYKFNPQKDMLPLAGDIDVDVLEFLKQNFLEKEDEILSHDLFLYTREKGKIVGVNKEYILSPRLDDLISVYISLKALCNSKSESNINVVAIFDNEEVGSATKQGAGSTFLFDTLKRINDISGRNEEDYRIAIANSFMVSADNAHAVHPNYAEKCDSNNRNYINKGPVIKFNANQKYTSDSVSASIFKMICEKAGVPYQVFHNRSDMPGGSTLGNISNTRVSLNTVDIGIPQFAMHSAVETAGVKDSLYTLKAFEKLFNSKIIISQDKVVLED